MWYIQSRATDAIKNNTPIAGAATRARSPAATHSTSLRWGVLRCCRPRRSPALRCCRDADERQGDCSRP